MKFHTNIITPDEQHRYSGGATSNPFFAGNFSLPKWHSEGILYNLDEYDKTLVQDIKLKEDEVIYRYRTHVTDIAKMQPFVKINSSIGLVYVLTDESMEGEKVEFVTRGVRASYLNLMIKS